MAVRSVMTAAVKPLMRKTMYQTSLRLVFSMVIAFVITVFIVSVAQAERGGKGNGGGKPPRGEDPPASEPVILFSMAGKFSSVHIYGMNADGSAPVKIIEAPRGVQHRTPSWKPDGSEIVFYSTGFEGPGLYIYDLSSGEVSVQLAAGGREPDWSPDGQWIIFTAPDPEQTNGFFDLYIVASDGSDRPVRLTSTPTIWEFQASWSPGGDRIALGSWNDSDESGLEIYELDFSASTPTLMAGDPAVDLIASLDLDDTNPGLNWSPDSNFVSFTDFNHSLYVVDVVTLGCISVAGFDASGTSACAKNPVTTLPSIIPVGRRTTWSCGSTSIVFFGQDLSASLGSSEGLFSISSSLVDPPVPVIMESPKSQGPRDPDWLCPAG